MKIVKPNVPAGQSSGGYIGTPQTAQWKKDWFADQKRWALLDCGCVIDIIHDRSLLIIDKFPDTEIHCDKCGRFSAIVKQMKTKGPPVKHPDTPLF